MPKIKVAIIGAGPSGFAVAEVLRREEYAEVFDLTIYESNSYVGGKCCTVTADGEVCNGQPGGYEVGAVLVSKHTESYTDSIKLIEAYGLGTSIFNKPGEQIATYISKGKTSDINKIGYHELMFAPQKFFRRFRGFDRYITDYIRYAHSKHAGYANRPKKLNKRLSKLYSRQVNLRLSGIMQGYGYADLDDKYLTAPALYYHQYVEAGAAAFPVYTLDTGTQGIWAKIASTYPAGTIRLNEPVFKVSRSQTSVIVLTPNSKEVYDYLVVATPLKPALKYLDIDKSQRKFLSKMKHNHYVTVLCGVSNFSYYGTFNLDNCTNKKYLGHVLCGYKRYPESDIVALYLYIKEGAASDDASILNAVESSLKQDFSARMVNRHEAKIFHWDDYFGHLSTKDLNRGWYDKFDKKLQGKDRTLYVSSGLHMETVGASVEYGTKLAEEYAKIWLNSSLRV